MELSEPLLPLASPRVLVHARYIGLLQRFGRPLGEPASGPSDWAPHPYLERAWRHGTDHVLIDEGDSMWVLQRRRHRLDPGLLTELASSFAGGPVPLLETYAMPLVLRVPMVGPQTVQNNHPPLGERCTLMRSVQTQVYGVGIETQLVAHTERGLSWFVDVHLSPLRRADGSARKAIFAADVGRLARGTTTEVAAFIGRVLDDLASFLADLEAEGFTADARKLRLPLVAKDLWFPTIGDIAWDVSLPTATARFPFLAVPAPTAVRPYQGPVARSQEIQRLYSPVAWRT